MLKHTFSVCQHRYVLTKPSTTRLCLRGSQKGGQVYLLQDDEQNKKKLVSNGLDGIFVGGAV